MITEMCRSAGGERLALQWLVNGNHDDQRLNDLAFDVINDIAVSDDNRRHINNVFAERMRLVHALATGSLVPV